MSRRNWRKTARLRGVIIALEDDVRLRRALAATPCISFYRYQVSFKLVKAWQEPV